MALFQESGQSPQRRNEEASTIAARLITYMVEHPEWIETLDDKSKVFLTDMKARMKAFGSLRYINAVQLGWLRDLYERTA